MENVEGRVVLDVLRHALTACNLASFSVVDCCQSLLNRRLEVLPSSAIARLSSCTTPAKGKPRRTPPLSPDTDHPLFSDTVCPAIYIRSHHFYGQICDYTAKLQGQCGWFREALSVLI